MVAAVADHVVRRLADPALLAFSEKTASGLGNSLQELPIEVAMHMQCAAWAACGAWIWWVESAARNGRGGDGTADSWSSLLESAYGLPRSDGTKRCRARPGDSRKIIG